MSRRVRLIVIPACLFAGFSGLAYALAEEHFAKPSVSAATTAGVKLGDPYRGETVFSTNCASCHGDGGKGGGIGPRLIGLKMTLEAAKSQIDNGGSVMPPALVKGQAEEDVLAFLDSIFAH
jgi:mono/diheme cytochrome c family protein